MIQNGCRWRGRRTWICRVEWEGNCLHLSMRLLWKRSAHFGADGELTRSGGRWVRQTVDVLCFSALFLSSAWESWEERDECWLTASGADGERLIRLCWPPAGFLPLMCPGHLCGVRAQPTENSSIADLLKSITCLLPSLSYLMRPTSHLLGKARRSARLFHDPPPCQAVFSKCWSSTSYLSGIDDGRWCLAAHSLH